MTRDHAAEHATRERVAREDGFASYYAKRKALAEGRRDPLPGGRRWRSAQDGPAGSYRP